METPTFQKKTDANAFHRPAVLRRLSSFGLLFVVCGLLAVHAALSHTRDLNLAMYRTRIAMPVFFALIAVILIVEGSLNKSKPLIMRVSSKNPLWGAILVAFTVATCWFDIMAGLPPFLLIPGLAALGLTYWSHQKPLFVFVLAGSAVTGGVVYLLTGKVSQENITIILTSMGLTFMSADIIRKNVMPSRERQESLEQENKELWNLSYRDTLTGLYNRRYVQQTALHLFTRAVRYREQLHVLMIDIDHFKKVNDKLGHAVGDEVIKCVAATIQTFIRTSDTVARYGGEEFIVYIVQSNSELTQFIANRIRDGVAATHFVQVPWPITISIGVSGLQDGDSIESLVDRADQYLYMSKHRGRNRVSGF